MGDVEGDLRQDIGGPSGNLLSSATPMEPLSGVSTKGFDQAQGAIRRMRDALTAFPPDVVKVLDALGDGEYVQSALYVSEEIGVPEKRIKEIHKALKTLGFAMRGTLMNDEGAVCGSGYWVSGEGWLLASGIEAAASVGRNPQGEDPEEGLRAEHERAVGEAETPKDTNHDQ